MQISRDHELFVSSMIQGVENISKPEGDFFLLDQIVFQLRHVGFGVAEDTGHRAFLKFVDRS